ncbi:MAG TPA: MBL fold metallo-hydrolase, partial [Nevskiaceae bacterium]|nr:MBL fold metallo-hydrolase [Nevskiaceae bacterium]
PRAIHQPFALAGASITLRPAGHILGAAGVLVQDDSSLYFSGDLGRQHDPLMRAPEPPPACDHLVIESTYGDRLHPPGDPFQQLGEVINRVARRGGVVVIPAFAVGRTQSLLYGLLRLKQAQAIPDDLPVYLNSPMAIDVTGLYRRHPAEHALGAAQCAAMAHVARLVNTADESRHLNTLKGPMVIIAGSGMATGGRVVHHLQAFASDARNAIVLAGFQAGGTRGAALAAGAESIKIHGAYVAVRADVVVLNQLSAHADQGELLAWLAQAPSPPRRVFVTHGEPSAADTLRRCIEERLHLAACVPEFGQDEVLAR